MRLGRLLLIWSVAQQQDSDALLLPLVQGRTAAYHYQHRRAAEPAMLAGNSGDAPSARLSEVEKKALVEVSQCLKQCGDTLTPLGSKRSFYSAIYTPGAKMGDWINPSSDDWDHIRAEWPELAERSDEDLEGYLPMLRANQLDYRSLKRLELNLSGPHSMRGK